MEQYINLETKCQTCYVVNDFSTEHITKKVGQFWDQECTTQGCKGESVVIGTRD